MVDYCLSDETYLRCSRKRFSVLRFLKISSAEVNLSDETGWTALHCAADVGDEEVTRDLLENGANVNLVNRDGSTPLHLACQSGSTNCIEAILDKKPNLNVQDQNLNTPLIIFVILPSRDERLLKKFLDAGADPNIPNSDGCTPLHFVARQSRSMRSDRFARLLIDYNANVNLKQKNGNTPLHLAILTGFEVMVQILLENGAYINTINEYGLTQMQIALSNKTRDPAILEHIGKQLIIQHKCEMQVNMEYFEEICKIKNLRNFMNNCDEELLALKNNKIGRSYITYYDILISNPEIIAKYLRNSDVMESLLIFDKKNYILGSRLVHNFHEGLIRYEAVQIGYKFCKKIFPFIPDICMDNIIQHLSNEDLNNLEKFVC